MCLACICFTCPQGMCFLVPSRCGAGAVSHVQENSMSVDGSGLVAPHLETLGLGCSMCPPSNCLQTAK